MSADQRITVDQAERHETGEVRGETTAALDALERGTFEVPDPSILDLAVEAVDKLTKDVPAEAEPQGEGAEQTSEGKIRMYADMYKKARESGSKALRIPKESSPVELSRKTRKDQILCEILIESGEKVLSIADFESASTRLDDEIERRIGAQDLSEMDRKVREESFATARRAQEAEKLIGLSPSKATTASREKLPTVPEVPPSTQKKKKAAPIAQGLAKQYENYLIQGNTSEGIEKVTSVVDRADLLLSFNLALAEIAHEGRMPAGIREVIEHGRAVLIRAHSTQPTKIEGPLKKTAESSHSSPKDRGGEPSSSKGKGKPAAALREARTTSLFGRVSSSASSNQIDTLEEKVDALVAENTVLRSDMAALLERDISRGVEISDMKDVLEKVLEQLGQISTTLATERNEYREIVRDRFLAQDAAAAPPTSSSSRGDDPLAPGRDLAAAHDANNAPLATSPVSLGIYTDTRMEGSFGDVDFWDD